MSALLNKYEFGKDKYNPTTSDEVNLNIEVKFFKRLKIYLKKYLNPVSIFQSNTWCILSPWTPAPGLIYAINRLEKAFRIQFQNLYPVYQNFHDRQ